jgi:hypothetical protein
LGTMMLPNWGKFNKPALPPIHLQSPLLLILIGSLVGMLAISVRWTQLSVAFAKELEQLNDSLTIKLQDTTAALGLAEQTIQELESQDERQRNNALENQIKEIQKTFPAAVKTYENILDLRVKSKNIAEIEKNFAKILVLLSEKNYSTASALIKTTDQKIAEEEQKVAAAFVIPENVAEKNTAPATGYSRQKVTSGGNSFLVDLVAGDLGSTKVIVDTASAGNCANDCPVLALGDYVSRNGAFAGINGSYFCPASYPSCAGKTNSFDTLLMNKDKVYFNSDNNVYSSVPAVIFSSGSVRFVGKSQEWGRDTSIDSMIANQPMLVSGKQSVFGGDGDAKKSSKSNRSFVANQGNTVYIGVVYSSSVAEAAGVLATLGMDNAINLDSGGSTALWSSGYKAGPGRAIPNAILFVRK